VMGFSEIGSHQLFAQAGFESWSSWVARCKPPAPSIAGILTTTSCETASGYVGFMTHRIW
jgi:hypothetical protein